MTPDLPDGWRTEPPKMIPVRITPKASTNRISSETCEDGTVRLRIYVTAVPEDGKANKAVLKLLARALGHPRSALTIVSGEISRDKIIRIET